MNKGLDSNTVLTNHAKCIHDSGFTFCARYFKESPSRLTHAEAIALSTAGLWIVSVVERGSPTSASYFSHAKGVADGDWAFAYASEEMRQPAGSTIYFAVDWDADLASLKGNIVPYFNGVLSAFSGIPAYHVGVYGSGLTCSTILKGTAVTHSWLSGSTGWNGFRSFTGWSLKQSIGGLVCGVQVDHDISQGNAGGWRLS